MAQAGPGDWTRLPRWTAGAPGPSLPSPAMTSVTSAVRPLQPDDRGWLEAALREHTAGPSIVSRGRLFDGLALPGLVAMLGGEVAGVVLYDLHADECEVVFLAALLDGAGAGTELLHAVAELARDAGCRRAWLVTTNDNTAAIRFYQRRGWDLVAIHRDALDRSRALKPAIPLIGNDGIVLRHELEFELRLLPGG
jgi:GNAT superfamily N-acetyltransferase